MKEKVRVNWWQRSKNNWIGLLLGIFALLLFALLFFDVRQKELNIKEGQLAESTIRAPKTIENEAETQAKKKLAAEAVSPEYTYDNDKDEAQVELVSNLFSMITEVENATSSKSKQTVTTEDKIAALKGKFEKLNADDISFYQGFPNTFYEGLFNLDSEQQSLVESNSEKLISEAMRTHIRNTNLDTIRQNTANRINYLNLSDKAKQLAKVLVSQSIVVNEAVSSTRTAELRQAARDNVNPVMIYQGEVIVREGEQIDAKAIQKLKILGLTSRETSIFPIVSLVMVIVIQLFMLLYIKNHINGNLLQVRFVAFYVSLMIGSILIMKFLHLFQTEALNFVPLIYPAAFMPLVLNLFINRRAGILAAIFQLVFAMFVFYDSIGTSMITIILVSYAFVGLMGTLMKQKRLGNQMGSALILLVFFPFLLSIMLITYQGLQITDGKTWSSLLCALIGSVLTFLLSVGLHPYIELLLNDDSMIVLNELSNPNQPLLKQLLEEAPGTYHHSMMVASLSANAVAEIGGRSLLTRVACYYHDIGKIKHANFFVENLPAGAENPHNFLLPEDSKQIIFGHVSEGAKILEQAQMPKMVIDICRQHHGTTLMRYFYVKAKEKDDEVTEADFRYPGPKPQTREAGVVNIADSCEAAVRAMDKPTNEKIQEFVHTLVQSRIEDGQLDDCGLTMKEIRMVEKSIVNGLCSTFHSRIKYPKMKSEAEKMKKEQEASEK